MLRALTKAWLRLALWATAFVAAAFWLEGHLALFAWLVGSGLGVPPGEDLLVATTGVLIANGELAAIVAIPMATVAVVISDTLIFCGGQLAQSTLSTKPNWLTERTAHYLRWLVGPRTVVAIALARFVPGLRTLVFVAVGARGLSRWRFVLIDACAAAVWVPIAMACGATIIAVLFGDDPLTLASWR